MAQFNSGYSSSEILSMQRDAAERVREMQRRAQQKLYQSNTQQMGGPNPMTVRQSVPSQHNGRSSEGIPAYSVPSNSSSVCSPTLFFWKFYSGNTRPISPGSGPHRAVTSLSRFNEGGIRSHVAFSFGVYLFIKY